MLLIVGLGNPEDKYAGNRHNIGFMIADAIATRYNFPPARTKFSGLVTEGLLDGHGERVKALILKPQTYYNDSGRAVREAAQFYKIEPEDIVVFHDELDLAPAKLRMKMGGGTAGNNGLKSITAHLGGDFRRARVGIGHPGDKNRVTQYVLGDFSKAERSDWVEEMIDACADAAPLLGARNDADARFMSRVALRLNPPKKTGDVKKQENTHNAGKEVEASTPSPQPADKQQKPASPFDKLKGLFGSE
ncbi:aminoacyl-tRNA hydrolase [Parvularcula flava]|uniref:Peptidyl-tRNA hydrolase n=1 Tax=Aquisalinus luteolus TaxID=1566827 RepID=A0A8J3EQG9_9PROT|nr:aminoacyl-tRNA hydrolase [Aquisalinus luteolus]NHK26959.1 aminoacyl-tRNA hydrolase [Aquisalinus luteolus]GGH93935.1 peptidyl-tRNA hydrolase [Aquisalinus luteolus]